MQAVHLVVAAALFLYLFVVVQAVELTVLEAVFVLLGLRRLEDRGQRVAKVHRADFASLGGADLRLVPRPVVAHTAPHCNGLLLEVDVLPCESADLADSKPGVVSDLDGQEHLYATFSTREDLTFWNDLAKECREEFKRLGTEGKCIEARELIIALPEEYTQFDPNLVLREFTEQFKKRYDVECVSALHHNKTKKNYHIHLIFSERRLLPEPEVKIATRSVFYDELGKRVRTKKEITGEDGKIREGCTVIKKGEVYESHLFTAKDEVFKNELFLDEAKQFYTALINRHIHDPERRLKVFDPNSVYLPTKKIGKNNPKAAEIEADNAARQDWNRTADMALVSGIAEAKIIEIRNEHVYNEASRSVQKHGWLPGLFRGIIQKAKEILQLLIRETEVPPKPTLSVDMAEYRKMQKLMVKVQDEARAIKQLMHGELPKLEKQLAETTGLFKGKERKALQEKIAGLQQEIERRMDRLPSILKEDGYPDVQAFKRTYDAATALVEQYNRDLVEWERQVNGEKQPQQKPPEKESIRKKLRDMEAEAKRRNDARRQEPRHRSYDYDRGR